MIWTCQHPQAWKPGLLIALGGLSLAACTETAGPRPERDELLVEVSADVGLDFTHYNGFTGYRYLVETMGGGVAWLDYDGDGMLDAYLVQSAPLEGSAATEETLTNRLMRNTGKGTFVDATAAAGVGDTGFGMGCAVGDYDGDGFADLYVINFGANVLYHNNGDGTFSDVTAAAGVGDEAWGVSAGFADLDRDGDLDLYLVNYLVFTCEMQAGLFPRRGGKAPAYPHPDRFDGAPDVLYENQGDGTFIDASASSGIASVQPGPGKGLGLGFSDVDDDGDADIYVANDSTRNFLFLNDGSGHFEEIGDIAGCSHNLNGESEASMGVDFGDTDGDGRIDLFMTHLDGETNTFYRNDSADNWVEWRDVTGSNGLARASVMLTGFGATFFDLEADRDLDLFIANGHVIDNIAEVISNRQHAQSDLLFLNQGDGQFDDVSGEAGSYFERRLVGRGTALGDFDGDGDPDILVGSNGDRALLLENRASNDNHWLRVRLVGGEGEPRDGQGARVTIEAGGQTQVRELWTCRSYASASENVLHFGLGQAASIARLSVRWPSGAVQEFTDLGVDREHTLHSD
ncbi:MAG: hypothetical protein ACI8QZ_004329 [Chlamydiales bacterium]|jgi:hypothetical protein